MTEPFGVMKSGDDLLSRVRGEYLEMPGLSLTLRQAQRLWALDHRTCSRLLSNLVRSGFLRQRRDGSYIRHGAGPDALFTVEGTGG